MNERLQELYTAYWNCENTRPLFTARIADGPYNAVRDRNCWMSVDSQLAKNEWELEHVQIIGDAYPLMCPNLGPDLFTACLGLELEFGPDTSWAVHNPDLCDPENYVKPVIRTDSPYYKKILELTEAFCEHSRGRYFVGITDLRPAADGLVAIRSPEQLCFDAIEEPDFIRQASMDLFEQFKVLFGQLCDITERYQKGTSNWMGVWHPGRQYVTSCDFGALKNLDILLEQKKLRGVQWVYGAGQPTAAHWIDVMRRTQEAGKAVHIDAYPDDVPVLLRELRPQGLLINLVGGTPAQARELFAMAEGK